MASKTRVRRSGEAMSLPPSRSALSVGVWSASRNRERRPGVEARRHRLVSACRRELLRRDRQQDT